MKAETVYSFGSGNADGDASMKNLLGGKGANLAEMAQLGIPVPPGFTITTEVCNWFNDHDQSYPESLDGSVRKALAAIEVELGLKFGDSTRPLLVSVRSGARASMPGMMETVLNIGLNDVTCKGLIAESGDARFVYDAQRRLMQMYADVVMEKAAGIEPAEGEGIRAQLEHELEKLKEKRGVTDDTELSADDLEALVITYRTKVREVLGKEFPEDPWEQLWGAISAVFLSWNGKRAIAYRRIEGLPNEWGTAVNVQAMVFGNLGKDSATGVAFTRNPATGENAFYGEWLPQAQGEDVVAGIRTPNPLNSHSRTEYSGDLPSLDNVHPAPYKELDQIQHSLEKHYRDMLDIEFTIQSGRLWMLQCRIGKRNGPAAVRIAAEMEQSGQISSDEAVMRVSPSQLDELLHPIIDPDVEKVTAILASGLPAGPGGATGRVVFTADDAVEWAERGEQVVLVREETNPEDVAGMRAAVAILTARGGMTSHAALVARGWGMCCIVGAGELEIDAPTRRFTVGDHTIMEGDLVTLNGTAGKVYAGELPLRKTDISSEYLSRFLSLCDRHRKLKVRTNADTPADAQRALEFGAEGIGLFRIEHMFYGDGSEEPLFCLRKMIMADSHEERKAALDELYPHMKDDIRETLRAMEGLPVTIRLMDPPLHEFIPHEPKGQAQLAQALDIDSTELTRRAEQLRETNPMMGHRGVRLGVTYPDITELQAKAILTATAELQAEGITVLPEIMVPLTAAEAEFTHQEHLVRRVAGDVEAAQNCKLDYLVGTMIEIPRATLMAGKIAETAEFFSYGTNDLTQMTFGFSRDDSGGFLPEYVKQGILSADPFATLDTGVGELVTIGIERGRATRPDLKVGICGEHGGDPVSVAFCHAAGMDYVSCSPFRVPIARLAAAQAVLNG
ncbi:MAG: pyruvate, phosphate dikinase [Candidatus Poseidoniia archaeon]|nr:pyruvate, phosphate dikinase [Euryarchaeota archaeon]MDP6534496.1 pyruvate, phosphate dikinase [Candidatus Poseidoniia archaeon]MDP6835492.1 pyruvate, phosphate dikinase [Candidatus Poseidoniia archaeon]HIH79445.1 pyruvate, phosphate dikinase [Candidatus Poseidoniia archaeon]